MKFTVKNFGPIREAKNIEVKPMTVFVGHGNTGKSYMAMLIYATIKALSSDLENNRWMMRRNDTSSRDCAMKIVEACAESNKNDACQAIEDYFKKWITTVSKIWKGEVQYCFGEDGCNLIEEGAVVKMAGSLSPQSLEIDLTDPEKSKISKDLLRSIYQGIKQKIDKELKNFNSKDWKILEQDEKFFMFEVHFNTVETLHSIFSGVLYDRKLRDILKPDNRRYYHRRSPDSSEAYYLPAIRGGIIQSYRTLVGALIEMAPWGGIRPLKQIPLFNGVLADFMRELISMGNQSASRKGNRRRRNHQRHEAITDVARTIETKILSGKVEVISSDETGPPDFQYSFRSNGSSKNLSLMNASSTVSELASVALFINNCLSPGDYFILEEPEAHLHPRAQQDISIMLAKLVKAGIKVLITTHSDIVSEQVSNFVYAAKVSDRKVENLSEKDCAVYLFHKPKKSNHGKTKVKNVVFDPEGGLATEDRIEVHSDLYNETAALMDLMDKQANDSD